MASSAEVPVVADCVLRLSGVGDFLKVLAVSRPGSSELTKRCLGRGALGSLDLGEVTPVDGEELKSGSRILESR